MTRHPPTSPLFPTTPLSGSQPAPAPATAGMQQMFDSWMNAWRSLGNPAHRPEGNAPGIWWPAAGFGANGAPFAMPQMPSMPSLADFSKAAAAMSPFAGLKLPTAAIPPERSEEHTSELQSPDHLVFRLLLEKK